MTEDEAKTKWCPFSRLVTTEEGSLAVWSGAPAGYNRCSGKADAVCNAALCIASACMAWRATDNVQAPRDLSRDRPPAWKPAGYCGLAGEQP